MRKVLLRLSSVWFGHTGGNAKRRRIRSGGEDVVNFQNLSDRVLLEKLLSENSSYRDIRMTVAVAIKLPEKRQDLLTAVGARLQSSVWTPPLEGASPVLGI